MSDGAPPIDDPETTRSFNRWLVAGPIVFLVLVIVYPPYLVVERNRRADADVARDRALVATGRALWEDNCSSCHGDFGEGTLAKADKRGSPAKAAKESDEGIPALNSQQFLEATTDDRIEFVVSAGVPGTEMEAWWNQFGGSLTGDDISALVKFVRSWEATAPDVPDWRNPGSGEGSLAPPPPGSGSAALTVTDTSCAPTEITIAAGAPFVLEITNAGTVRHSVGLRGLKREVRVLPGQTVGATFTTRGPGEFGFECFGPDHDSYVGEGVLKAS